MDVNHGEWTDKLSDYLDDELPAGERAAVEAHLAGCAECARVLADLKRVVARAQALDPRPPQNDVWAAVASQIEQRSGGSLRSPGDAGSIVPFSARKRVTFTLPQLAAAAVLLVAVSAGLAWTVADRLRGETSEPPSTTAQATAPVASPAPDSVPATPNRTSDDVQVAPASLADPQYDAAVADLENALKEGRGRLDANTIAIVEHNLQIIDQAIDQARQALAGDPANSYLSSHLFEARRRKLDLLRRAAALTESD